MSSSDPTRGPANPWGRFIPREEMGDYASWQPNSFGELPRKRPPLSAPAPPPPAEPDPALLAPPPPSEADWLARIAEAREQAYQDGLRDGQETAEMMRQQHQAQVGRQFAEVVGALDAQWDQLEQGMAKAVTRTAVQLARQVVRHELVTAPELVARVAEEAIHALVMTARHLRLRVAPADHALVAQGAAELLKTRGVQLMADPAVEAGGCVLESDIGQIDARIAGRWAQAAAVFGRKDAWDAVDEPLPAVAGHDPAEIDDEALPLDDAARPLSAAAAAHDSDDLPSPGLRAHPDGLDELDEPDDVDGPAGAATGARA